MILLLFLAGYLLLAPSPPDDGRWDDYAWDTVVLTGKAADPGCPADGSRDRRTFTLKQICSARFRRIIWDERVPV